MAISSDQISVLVQGTIDKYTCRCIQSVRKYMPDSPIVLSTWGGI